MSEVHSSSIPSGWNSRFTRSVGVGGGRIGAGGDLEQPWAHPDDPEAGHAGRHGVVAHLLPGLVQVQGDPRRTVGAVGALVEADDLGVEIGPAHLARQRRAVLGRPPAVVAGGRDLQEAGHAGDLEVRALGGHQRKSLCFGGFEAKYAAAFPKKARSLSCSATWRRSRNSSVRSAALNGSSDDPATVSSRRRSSRTHRANELSDHRQLGGHLGHRSAGIDHAMRGLGLELQRELPPRSSHIGHPSSRPEGQLVRCPLILGNLIPLRRSPWLVLRLPRPPDRSYAGLRVRLNPFPDHLNRGSCQPLPRICTVTVATATSWSSLPVSTTRTSAIPSCLPTS